MTFGCSLDSLFYTDFFLQMIEVEDSLVKNCNDSSDCWVYDINMQCSDTGCECRDGMKYNK